MFALEAVWMMAAHKHHRFLLTQQLFPSLHAKVYVGKIRKPRAAPRVFMSVNVCECSTECPQAQKKSLRLVV